MENDVRPRASSRENVSVATHTSHTFHMNHTPTRAGARYDALLQGFVTIFVNGPRRACFRIRVSTDIIRPRRQPDALSRSAPLATQCVSTKPLP